MMGNPPIVDDNRVILIKGIFQETLEPFLKQFKFKNRLVINFDADLYSSTLFVLLTIN